MTDDLSALLPRSPEAAFMLAMVYSRLGGSFSVASNGQRYFGQPEPCLFRTFQLADARPHEQFQNADEWRGAIKLVAALLQRLDEADSDMVFGAMAEVAVDDRKFTTSIEEPKRTGTSQ